MNMKKIQSTIIIAAALIAGCKSEQNTADIVISDIEAKEYLLTDLASDIQILTLRAPIPMDEISNFKVYGDHVLIIDKNRTKLFDFYKGNMSSVLDKAGRGPGEYFSIDSYSYDPHSSHLKNN